MLDHLQRKIKALETFNFKSETLAVITEHKDKLADLQAEQLAQGLNSKGEKIGPEYRPFTIQKKKSEGVGLGRVTDRVTFFQTGELYRKLRAEIRVSAFAIKADSFKFDKMIKRSGVNTVGLNDDSREKFILGVTRPGILKAYKQKVTDVS